MKESDFNDIRQYMNAVNTAKLLARVKSKEELLSMIREDSTNEIYKYALELREK
jgi:hypothetical protein